MTFLIFAFITLISAAGYIKHIKSGILENQDSLKKLAEVEGRPKESVSETLGFMNELIIYLFIFVINYFSLILAEHGLSAIPIVFNLAVIIFISLLLIFIVKTIYQLKAFAWLSLAFIYCFTISLTYAKNGHYENNLRVFLSLLFSFFGPIIVVIIAYFIGRIRLGDIKKPETSH